MIIKSKKSNSLVGNIIPPADKSISHRAVILSTLSKGESQIKNLLLSEDIKVTLAWAKSIGVEYYLDKDSLILRSNFSFKNKYNNQKYSFYLGNSGTSARLLMGVMAGFNSKSIFWGDPSLQRRPMLRVIEPLKFMGAKAWVRDSLIDKFNLSLEDLNSTKAFSIEEYIKKLKEVNKDNINQIYLPIIIEGGNLKGINYTLKIASAQVKSAILLASLFTKDETIIQELAPTRDHTENMLLLAGVDLKIKISHNNAKTIIKPKGFKELRPQNWQIPADFSSSAFIIVAALIVPESQVIIQNVNLNPLRTGLLTVLKNMGANIDIIYKNKVCGEKYGDIKVTYTQTLKPALVTKELTPLLIDEFPILACLASIISGVSKFLDVEELRYKESDRILSIEKNLNKLGIKTESTKDSLTIYGNPNFNITQTIEVVAGLDHRIAMSFLVLGLALKKGIVVKNAQTINTSFPNFIQIMQSIKANIQTINP